MKLLGEKKLLWRRGKSLGCQEHSSSLQILSCITSKIQVWLNDDDVVCYILHRKLYSAAPAISWSHNTSWGMDQAEGEGLKLFLEIDLRQTFKSIFAAATIENEEQCIWSSWRIAGSLSKWNTWILRSASRRGQHLACTSLQVCSLYPGTSSRPSPRALVLNISSRNISLISWSIWDFLWDLSLNPALTWSDPA